MKVDWKELAKAGEHWLLLFDSVFSEDNVSLHSRPLKSAMWLVREGISELPPGESKDNYFDREWFAALVVAIQEWYEDRYGSQAFSRDKTLLYGLVHLHGTPVRLEIPQTISEVQIENETSWLIFPDAIHETESILSFFLSKPNLRSLSPEELTKLEEQVTQVVKITRRVNLNLNFASNLPDKAKQMVAGVWGHVEKGVADILTLKSEIAAVGCWELHLAVEKAFKVLIHQNGNEIKGHDLVELSNKAKLIGLNVTQETLQKLPHWKTSIEYRYGEKEIAIDEAVEVYIAALHLLYEITTKLRRDLVINNAKFLLKKPNWVGRK
ncbi:hypothetical protein ACO0K0_07750 [Undibacterium sp. SXout11W]|uniref:hypothetical protein n=1 Tax=Undibacterium sp. SXout11W TaxID=3413050 RepID=UPI003BF06DCC